MCASIFAKFFIRRHKLAKTSRCDSGLREGMEGEHTPETDLIRRHQDLEEGERFESSDLILERCCFLALLMVDTHLF